MRVVQRIVDDRVEKLMNFSYGQPRTLIGKGYSLRVHMIVKTLNSLQREPQRTDLNMRHKLISHPSRPFFICHVGVCRFISPYSVAQCL